MKQNSTGTEVKPEVNDKKKESKTPVKTIEYTN